LDFCFLVFFVKTLTIYIFLKLTFTALYSLLEAGVYLRLGVYVTRAVKARFARPFICGCDPHLATSELEKQRSDSIDPKSYSSLSHFKDKNNTGYRLHASESLTMPRSIRSQ